MRSRPCLTAADARLLLDAALAEASRRGLPVAVAIVDEAGVPLVLERRDGARLHTPEAAWLKARTAAITHSATSTLQAAVQTNPALLAFPHRLPLNGGLPLVYAGTVVGGVGSSGGEPDEDVAVCEAAVGALARFA